MFAPGPPSGDALRVPVRRALAVRTIFNFLGPLTNPAGASRQLIGVSDPRYLETMAGALALLGTEHALLVSARTASTSSAISAPTRVIEVRDGELRELPRDARGASGWRAHPPAAIPGGDPAQNAATTRAILAGEDGAARDLAVLNAGAAIYAAGRAESLADGVQRAQAAIDSGAARRDAGGASSRPRDAPGRRRRGRERARRDRRGHARGARAAAAPPPARGARCAGGGRERARGGRPALVRRALRAHRAVGDRRAQAPLAVGRRDPRRRPAPGRGRRLRARRRRARSRC